MIVATVMTMAAMVGGGNGGEGGNSEGGSEEGGDNGMIAEL